MTEYEQIQKVKYRSFESENEKWKAGQRRCIQLFVQPHLPPMMNEQKPYLNILDCACGDGVGLDVFSGLGYSSTGIEFEEEKVKRAKAKGHNVWCRDMHDPHLAKVRECFDVVYSSHSLEHAHEPETVLHNFYEMLKPEGKLFLVLPFPDRGPDDAHCGKYKLRTDQGNTTTAGLMDVLEGCGFKWEEVRLDTWREEEVWVRARKI